MSKWPSMHIGKEFTDDEGRTFRAVQAKDLIPPFAFVWIDGLSRAFLQECHKWNCCTMAYNDNPWSISPKNFFWALIKGDTPPLPLVTSEPQQWTEWTEPRGNYIIGYDPAAGAQDANSQTFWNGLHEPTPMQIPDSFKPGDALLSQESRKAWIIGEIADGLFKLPENAVKWNQVIFSSAELRMIPVDDWATVGLRLHNLNMGGHSMELWETRGMDGCLNFWFVEAAE